MSTSTKIKERPILFSSPMVRAILDGRKTQTRRIVRPSAGLQSTWASVEGLSKCPSNYLCEVNGELGAQFQHPLAGQFAHGVYNETDSPYGWFKCPYGKPVDLLWVRESWRPEHSECDILYRADDYGQDTARRCLENADWFRKDWQLYHHSRQKPSIHMPRWASRITLEITNVRVERLQDISEADALVEGIISDADYADDPDGNGIPCGLCRGTGLYPALGANLGMTEADCISCDSPTKRFSLLWDKINGKKHPWSSNPWVWCISFRRIEDAR